MAKFTNATKCIQVYKKLYSTQYGKQPAMNQYSAKWMFYDLLESLSVEQITEALEYFFKTPNYGHSVTVFARNADKYVELVELRKMDAERRRRIMKETGERVEH